MKPYLLFLEICIFSPIDKPIAIGAKQEGMTSDQFIVCLLWDFHMT